MSYRSNNLTDHSPHHAHDHARPHVRRPAPLHAPAPTAASRNSSYTIAHAGKQVRIGPVVFWIVVGTVTVMGAWSAATATYFAFRDDVLTRLIARQASMQYAYEDRIAELRARLDRTTSRQLLDQEQFDQKLDQIVRRQSALESRAAAMNSVPDISITGSIKPPGRGAAIDSGTSATPKPSPINDTVIFVAPPDREARLEARTPANVTAQPIQLAKAQGLDTTLVRLQTSLDQVETRQLATLNAVEDQYESRIRRMRGVFSDLGLDLNQMQGAAPKGGIGGPFVPVKPPSKDADTFDRQLYRISVTRAQIDRLNRTLALVPYRKPVLGEVEFSSGFGVRTDPFLGRPAMHTGLDFRASMGDPVRATANGRVDNAGWSGGYGRMIEIDHGNGLATRYGHLSEIKVKIGDVVKIGQIIGAVGSTGRSTGPHLHYETRIDGDAVDPQKFLRAGVRLGSS
ncbi:M23 family metallopeptidase [Bradyrhizobium sp. U87765 SZCCT0131]|uniref:M23 family metallopeptidase n=1 Tax=unclassified Bradyrhizobium TaxID=2631580 RepID=UPI001BAC3D02|nr:MULTISPECIES: M23 family metallopeptidase [unclassified Bradyrhizobium]MBR1220357.1 M23 family metallopeptidase [Bradyrhizobium sp. U87765 SZCCT0131]MBR1263188.1 M23 family metallopeptidase [Bradyrhizobium sp. U87765 SZCCT0134]MBR1306929.1 M23 family metallopeptidase [Bradyrhizobium sp. U87765 SZCCT0110]MBR1323428.1 M23 family metallopeptidase [Bradyrhizobium sp. U87765 SZCCT0109]MBR1345883.1 M23 family metallopeptidase [Bradyrhizobium sp. U87765 SZCCT0048]